MADDPNAPPGDGQSRTVDSLAERQERTDRKLDELIGKVDKLLGGDGLPKAPASPESSSSSSPDSSAGSVEEQVQAELARRDKQAADDARAAEHDSMKADLAKLRETPPKAPARRATKLLGWGDGRG